MPMWVLSCANKDCLLTNLGDERRTTDEGCNARDEDESLVILETREEQIEAEAERGKGPAHQRYRQHHLDRPHPSCDSSSTSICENCKSTCFLWS